LRFDAGREIEPVGEMLDDRFRELAISVGSIALNGAGAAAVVSCLMRITTKQ
jgi:hypothetical protein